MADDDAGNGGAPNDQPSGDQGGPPAGQEPPKPGPPKDGGAGGDQAGSEKKFTQADLDRKIEERLAREKKKQDGNDAKVTAAQQEAAEAKSAHDKLMAGLAEALGLKKDDAPPDPAALQQTLAQRENRVSDLEGQNEGLRVELAAWQCAVENGANPVRLMDSRSFLDKLGAIDRKAEDRGKQIDAAVKAAIEADESLKAAGVPRLPRPDPTQGAGKPAPTGAERGNAEAARRFGTGQKATTTTT